MTNTWKQDAYDKGALARREGRDNTENPYSDLVNEELFDDWAEGWWAQNDALNGLKGECAS